MKSIIETKKKKTTLKIDVSFIYSLYKNILTYLTFGTQHMINFDKIQC